MKWSFPHFDYMGEMMMSMASFKAHAVFGFWKASLMKDKSLMDNAKSESSMGHSGKILSIKDLPSDKTMTSYIKEAMKLNEDGVKLPSRPKSKEPVELAVPSYLSSALKKSKKAEAAFKAFPQSHRKEYIMWFEEAKAEETRDKRMEQGLEWMAEGKSRNWKYMKK